MPRSLASPSSSPPLAQLQRALMRALHAPASNWGQARIVAFHQSVPDPNCAIGLYRRMGALRFEREVAREFPRLRALLGGEELAALARAFVASHRSRSYTLEGYADALPRFIARTRGRDAAHALASFELALRRAERAPANPVAARPGTLAPAPGARVTSGPLESDVAVFQRDGRAAWLDVAPAEVPLLRSLLRGARVDRAVARTKLSPARIRAAFERWIAAGLLIAPSSRQ